MNPILGRRTIAEFRRQFPFYSPRVVRWRPSGLFEVRIWLNDNHRFIFSYGLRRTRLWLVSDDEKKGRLVYDSRNDNRKGV